MLFQGVNVPLAKNNDAKAFTQREQILQAPDNVIGNPFLREYERFMFDETTNRMVYDRVTTSVGLETIWKEIPANSCDNIVKSRRRGNLDVGRLEYTFQGDITFSFKNYGDPFPIEMVENTVKGIMQLRPVMLFQEENSSTNYSNNRIGSGKNGIGAKATNIFSKYFRVDIDNADSHLRFVGEWRDNKDPRLTEGENHYSVVPYNGNVSSTTVTFIPDLQKFGLKSITSDIIRVFNGYMLNFSYANKIPVTINNVEYNVSDVTTFANMYFVQSSSPDVLYVHYPEKKKTYNPWDADVEFLARFTPNSSVQVSFVNGLYTPKGGSHVEAVYNAIAEVLVEKLNEPIIKELKKEIYKKKKKDAGEKIGKITDDLIENIRIPPALLKSRTITNKDIKKHVSVIINIQINNPKFIGQTKDVFDSEISVELPKTTISILNKWQLKDILKSELKSKVIGDDFKDIKKVAFQNKFENPNNWKKSKGLKLFLIEGDSAATYTRQLIDCYPRGKDYLGLGPLKGVPLNVLTATSKQLKENNEFLSIINNINLRLDIPEDQMDTYYLDDRNFATLYYDELVILTDSDVDGLHIRGLILLMFFRFWRSLITRGFIKVWLTPYLRVSSGKEQFSFYTSNEWDNWIAEYNANYNVALEQYKQGLVAKPPVPADKFHYEWFKGLGTSTQKNVEEDYKVNRSLQYTYDQQTFDKMTLAFDKRYADARKEWVRSDIGNTKAYTQTMTLVNINDFIDTELVLFGKEANARSLKRVYDGLSSAQRKIIHYTFKHFKVSSTSNKTYTPRITERFVQGAGDETNYHHGGASLAGVTEGLATFYIGYSNISLLEGVGGFGTRFENGKDCASSRYTKVAPSVLLGKLFREEDLPVLNYKNEEGSLIEPVTFIPLISNVLLAGADAMGSGWSSTIPCFNPFEIIGYYKHLLQEGSSRDIPSRMKPWYFGFQGEIKIVDRKSRDEMFETDDDSKYSVMYYGNFNMNGNQVHVTELPIGMSGKKYKMKLEEWEKDSVIKRFEDKSTVDIPYFIIHGWTKAVNHKELNLVTSEGYGNFTCLDNTDTPVPIQDTRTIILEHFRARQYFYKLRQEHEISVVQAKIDVEEQKRKICELAEAGIFPITKTKKSIQVNILEQYNLDYNIFDRKMKASMFSSEGYQELMEHLQNLYNERQIIVDRDNNGLYLNELSEFEDAIRKFYEVKLKAYNDKFQASLGGKRK